MGRGPLAFKQADVTRALKAARAGGIKVGGFEVDPASGKITVFEESRPALATSPLDAWQEKRRARSPQGS